MIQYLSAGRLAQAILFAVFTVSMLACPLLAQPGTAQQQAADELFAASRWEQAAQVYAQITASDPANGQAWQNLGECYAQTGRLNESLQAFTSAVQHNFRPLMNKVNVARMHVAMGDTRKAFAVLKEVAASGQGPRLRGFIVNTGEFRKIYNTPEFQQFLKDIAPCQTAEFRQFDFWIGDWAVENPAGQKVGDNLVTREQDGCLLVEHWKSGRGIETGTSFNYYDIRDKKFHQIYFDNSGNAGAYPPMAGGLVDNKMVMISDEKASPVFRWTWYVISPGKVRQMAEQSRDGQKTWQTVWDSTYVNKAQPADK